MALKDILVHLDATEASANRLDIAVELAQRHGAHLVGLYVLDVLLPYGIAADASGAGVAMLYDEMRKVGLESVGPVEANFRERLRRDGIAGGEWRMVEGISGEIVPLHARYADLAILGQQDPDGAEASGAILSATLFGSGRPILVVPYTGRYPTVGRRVLIGWNATREAARAVNDAMPILQKADQVTALAVNPERGIQGHGDEPAADIALHLSRHGVNATAAHMVAPDVSDGEALLNAVAEQNIDLLVLGAYGHSRLRQMVLGGVTSTLLGSMTVPVLLSH